MKDDVTVTPTSTHWGTYFAETRDGRLTGVQDYSDDPDPAVIGPGIVDMVDHPTRIAQPMVRKSYLESGPNGDRSLRGKEPFVAVEWDRALDIAAAELDRVRKAHGNKAIFGGSYGWASAGRFHHAQSQLKRFLNCSGGFTSSKFTYSFAAAEAMIPHVLGSYREFLNTTTGWSSIAEHGELVVAFGGIPIKNSQIEAGGSGTHRQREGIC